ncbi:uncharacterized protein LOC143212648 [Lasioglossum baleicum]|uniref:uncharacterized protein LOC143212648 n=1 Tax=Lasioglossum baleicum TaxID=434251 RepID=UPI003FCE2320
MTIVNASMCVIQLAYAYRENNICQIYIDNSANVYHEICQTPWYALPLKVQKLFLHVLQRTSKGCVPVIGGIFVPSRKGFTWMLNTACSYFTVMYSLRYKS